MRYEWEALVIAAVWLVTLALLLAWSGLMWGAHVLLTSPDPWMLAWARALERWPWVGQWLADIPGWQDHLIVVIEWWRWMFGWVRGAAPWLGWVVWGMGAAALLSAGLALTALLVLLRPAARRPGGS